MCLTSIISTKKWFLGPGTAYKLMFGVSSFYLLYSIIMYIFKMILFNLFKRKMNRLLQLCLMLTSRRLICISCQPGYEPVALPIVFSFFLRKSGREAPIRMATGRVGPGERLPSPPWSANSNPRPDPETSTGGEMCPSPVGSPNPDGSSWGSTTQQMNHK